MSKFCPSCGEELVDSAKFCKNCGKNLEDIQFEESNSEIVTPQHQPSGEENGHTLAIVAGYILAFLIPLFGIIIAIYLMTRKDSARASKHGKFILIIAVIIWAINFFAMM